MSPLAARPVRNCGQLPVVELPLGWLNNNGGQMRYFRAELIGLLAMLSTTFVVHAAQFSPCVDAATAPALQGSMCKLETVPADYRSPNPATSEEVTLFVRKFPAQGGPKGSVWMIAGGPGESGASFYSLVPRVRRSFPGFDIIIPDHRGTGFSTRLCPVEEAVGSPGGTALAGAEWASCFTRLGNEPKLAARFSVTNAAHDLDLLIEREDSAQPAYVYGVSYGTQLVLRSLQVGRPNVAGVILDSLVPLQTAPEWDLSRRSFIVEAVGRQVLAQCDRSGTCAKAVGEPVETAYRRLLGKAEQNPVLLTSVPGKNLKRLLGSLLDVPEAASRIPYLISDLDKGHDTELKRVLALVEAKTDELGSYPQSPPSIPLVSIVSNSENNLRLGQTAADVQREEKSMLFTSSLPGLLLNAGLPSYARDEYYGRLPDVVPRMLVMQGTLDPKTHYDGALSHVMALRQVGLGPVDMVTLENGSHFALWTSPSCFESAVRFFLAGAAKGNWVCSTR
jgi:pimeloyl-ACP methyl ester carboxylesterase